MRPSRARTTKHAHNKRETKQGTTPERGQQLPCEVEIHPVPKKYTAMQKHANTCQDNEQTWNHTTLNQQMIVATIKHGYIHWMFVFSQQSAVSNDAVNLFR